MITKPLSEIDRQILIKRYKLLPTLFKYFYGTIAIGIGVYLIKLLASQQLPDENETKSLVTFIFLMVGTLAVTYSLLLIWEKPIRNSIKYDLDESAKRLIDGTLLKAEGSGDDPVCLHIFDEQTNETHIFELRTISDFRRVKYIGLEHKPVTIEYAPNSGVVLGLYARE